MANSQAFHGESSSSGFEFELLKNELKQFRNEFDLKMSIIHQILESRQEQYKIQEKLMEQESSLFEKLLEHWNDSVTRPSGNRGIPTHYSGTDSNTFLLAGNSSMEFVDEGSGDGDQGGEGFADWNQMVSKPRTRRKNRLQSRINRVKMEQQEATNADLEFDGSVLIDPISPSEQSDASNDRDADFDPRSCSPKKVRTSFKKTPVRIPFVKDKDFPSEHEALKFLSHENCWTANKAYQNSKRFKKIMYCKHEHRCLARVFIIRNKNSDGELSETTTLYRSIAGHTHESSVAVRPFPAIVKDRIRTLISEGVMNQEKILERLIEEGYPEPTPLQVERFLKAESLYVSDDENEDGSDSGEECDANTTKKRKKKRPRRVLIPYDKENEFATEREAHEHIACELTWRLNKRIVTKRGTPRGIKSIYYCSKREHGCLARIYLFQEFRSDGAGRVSLFRGNVEHRHQESPGLATGTTATTSTGEVASTISEFFDTEGTTAEKSDSENLSMSTNTPGYEGMSREGSF